MIVFIRRLLECLHDVLLEQVSRLSSVGEADTSRPLVILTTLENLSCHSLGGAGSAPCSENMVRMFPFRQEEGRHEVIIATFSAWLVTEKSTKYTRSERE
jgi:hypothetical protein